MAAAQDKPPVARNQAPVAGAIKWSRSLFARCKRTYVLLNTVEHSLLQEPTGRQACAVYLFEIMANSLPVLTVELIPLISMADQRHLHVLGLTVELITCTQMTV